jgi:hypothetical protein
MLRASKPKTFSESNPSTSSVRKVANSDTGKTTIKARDPGLGQYQTQLKQIWIEHVANTTSEGLDRRVGEHA